MMSLDEWIARLRTADETIDANNAKLLTEATDDLVTFAQEYVEHEITGNMIESTHRFGPYPNGRGIVEARIESGASYAGIEAARGGSHDWPARTVAEDAARITKLRDDVAGLHSSVG